MTSFKHFILSLFLLFGSVSLAQESIDVLWKNPIDVSVNGNSIHKNTSTGIGGAKSANLLAPGKSGWAEFIVAQAQAKIAFGFINQKSTDNTLNVAFEKMDYSVVLWTNNKVRIYKRGDLVGQYGNYAVGDKIKIERSADQFRFYKNNILLTTLNETNSSQKSFLVNGAISGGNAGINSVKVSFPVPLTVNEIIKDAYCSDYNTGEIGLDITGGAPPYTINWSTTEQTQFISNLYPGVYSVIVSDAKENVVKESYNLNYCVKWDADKITGMDYTPNTLTKNTGKGWDNNMAASVNQLIGSEAGFVQYTIEDPAIDFALGLNRVDVTNTGTSLPAFDFTVMVSSKKISIFNRGQLLGQYGKVQQGDIIKIEKSGITVSYYLNDVLLTTQLSDLANLDLNIRAAILKNGNSINNVKASFFRAPLQLSVETTNIINPSEPNSGSITAYAEYGLPPYKFVWENSDVKENTLGDLPAGQYTVTVSDALGNKITKSVTISSPIDWFSTANISFSEAGIFKINQRDDGTGILNMLLEPSANGYIEFSLKDINTTFNLLFTNSDSHVTNDNFGMRISGSDIYIMEDGRTTGERFAYAANDIIRIGTAGSKWYLQINGREQFIDDFAFNAKMYAELTLFSEQLLLGGSGFSSGYLKTGPIIIPALECPNDFQRNWVYEKSFDKNGNTVSETKVFADYLGRVTQTLTKDLSKNNVIATQTIYDVYGRKVLQTLPAPLYQKKLCYKDGFITNEGNLNYTYRDFDIPNYTTTSSYINSGEVSNPGAVRNSTQGTLGWYYSNNNTAERYVPSSGFPYTRVEYDEFNGGGAYKSSSAGEQLKHGSGHENQAYTIPVTGELTPVFGYMKKWVLDNYDASTGSFSSSFSANLKAVKSIQYDANGKETVTFYDLAGNILASGLSGQENGGPALTKYSLSSLVSVSGKKSNYIDVHIPKGCESDLKIEVSGIQATSIAPYSYKILDLKTGEYLKNGTSLFFDAKNPVVQAGVYRIIFTAFATNEEFVDFTVSSKVNYYDYSAYFYDKAGRLKAVVPVAGFNSTAGGVTSSMNEVARAYPVAGMNCHHEVTSPLEAWSKVEEWGVAFNGSLAGYENCVSCGYPSLAYCYDDLVINQAAPVANEEQITALKVSLKYITPPAPPSDNGDPTGRLISPDENFYDFLESLIEVNDPSVFRIGTGSPDVINSEIDNEGPPIDGPPYVIEGPIGGGSSNPNPTQPPPPPVISTTYEVTFTYNLTTNTGLVLAQNQPIKIYCRLDRTLQNYTTVTSTILTVQSETPHTYFIEGLNNTNLSQITLDPISLHIKRVGELYGFQAGAELSNKWGLALTSTVTKSTGTVQHKMVESYDYNSLSQTLASTKVDEGKAEIVYRKDGNPKFTQNAKQKVNGNKFSYVNYDKLGRTIEMGEYQTNATNNLLFENYTDRQANNSNANSVHNFTESATLQNVITDDNSFIEYDIADANFTTLTGITSLKQEFLSGRVSKTKNNNKTTWYSYDDFGRLLWSVQRLENMATGANTYSVKTLEYVYDFNGNVTETIYQKGQSDEFHHFYEYDRNLRPVRVYAGRNSAAKTEQAEYQYYQHGALKRVELADNMQGLDYVYTINGWLKAMNNADLNGAVDPYKDGTVNSVNHTPKDLFGFEIDYFSGDYEREGTGIANTSAQNTGPQYYNGLINSFRWKTDAKGLAGFTSAYNNRQLRYQYTYDNKYQLAQATFSANNYTPPVVPGQPPVDYDPAEFFHTEDYKVWNMSYDKNGNIRSLYRNAYASTGTALAMDKLSYDYTPFSNKLSKVNDDENSTMYPGEIKQGQGTNNYQYDEIGQMTTDVQKTNYIDYNSYGLVTTVWKDAAKTIAKASYKYDEGGKRISKKVFVYNASNTLIDTKETFYVRDVSGNVISAYEKNISTPLAQSEVHLYGASRLGMVRVDGAGDRYVYELADHLGNVRTTFVKKALGSITTHFDGKGATDYLFSFNDLLDKEKDISGNIGVSVITDPHLQNIPIKGSGITFKVSNGQVINAEISAWYHEPVLPVAYLVAELKDAAGNIINSAQQPIASGDGIWTPITLNYTVMSVYTGQMTLTVYPLNNDPNQGIVWFDDLTINSSNAFAIPQQLSLTDYYPHGGILPGRNYVASTGAYRYAYQGQFAELDEETGYNTFDLRMYDPQLGRFFSPDPRDEFFSPYLAMGNDPTSTVDPTGGATAAGGGTDGPQRPGGDDGGGNGIDFPPGWEWLGGIISGNSGPGGGGSSGGYTVNGWGSGPNMGSGSHSGGIQGGGGSGSSHVITPGSAGSYTLTPFVMDTPNENSNDDVTGFIQNSTPSQKLATPVTAALNDAVVGYLNNLTPLGTIDDAIVTYGSEESTGGDHIKATVNVLLAGVSSKKGGKVNGNSKLSTKAQINYRIKNIITGKYVKPGISSGKVNKLTGIPNRASKQADGWNKAAKKIIYKPEVVNKIPEGPGARQKALDYEKMDAQKLLEEGHLNELDKHKRPR